MTQPELFTTDPCKECSAAAISKSEKVLWFERVKSLYVKSPDGLTADEAADLLGRDKLTIRPRVSELKSLGWIIPTGERRQNAQGKTCAVFVWHKFYRR